MKKKLLIGIPLLIVAAVVAALLIPGVASVAANGQAALFASSGGDDCNDTSWHWPECHFGMPSIPRVSLGGPRPPLADKNSVWCNGQHSIITVAYGIGWYRYNSYKHTIRFWPDYYTIYYDKVYWNGVTWVAVTPEIDMNVDCDA